MFIQLAVIFNCIGKRRVEDVVELVIESICEFDCWLYIVVFSCIALIPDGFSDMFAIANPLAALAAACPNVAFEASGGGGRRYTNDALDGSDFTVP